MLTRVFSVTMYYHFAFMVVALALMGLAISGVVIYLLPSVFRPGRSSVLSSGFMLAFALSCLVALDVTISNPISVANWQVNTGRLVKIFAAAGVPFVCSGFALSLAISSAGKAIGRIYAFDLIGAAVGCLLVIPIVGWLTGPGAVIFAGCLGAVAAVLFAVSAKVQFSRLLLALSCVVALVMAVIGLREPRQQVFGRAGNPDKFLGKRPVEFERWNAFSQITVAPAGAPDHKWLFIDADAATRMWNGEVAGKQTDTPRRYGEVRVASLVYSIRNDGTALIIGPGGGTDVISALHHGVKRVVGVEVNPIIVKNVMRGSFSQWNGDLYRDPRVHVYVDEGRSFVRRSDERYASIQATLVDTWAASSSGAFTLSENNLYTQEAFEEFLNHLRPDGVLTVTRWYDAKSPKEFLRLLALGRSALESMGVSPAQSFKHFVLATDNERRGTLLLARAPFSDRDLSRLREKAAEAGLRLLFLPDGTSNAFEDASLSAYLKAPSSDKFLSGLAFDARPTRDDKPFFFYSLRPADFASLLGRLGSLERDNIGLVILLSLLGLSLLVTVALVAVPLLVFRRDELQGQTRTKLRLLGYFGCLGLAFILVEIGFMQKFVLFLGHPIYALAVVLAVLLLSSGVGSSLSGAWVDKHGVRKATSAITTGIAVLMVLYAVGLGPMFRALLGSPLVLRIAIAATLVALPGLLMGALLPIGVRVANGLGEGMVPWAWGMNGITSVLGSILAVTLAMNFGFVASLLLGTATYIAAARLVPTSMLE